MIPDLFSERNSGRRDTSERTDEHSPAEVGNLILVGAIRTIEVVNSDLREVLDGIFDTEVKSAEVGDTINGVGGTVAEDDVQAALISSGKRLSCQMVFMS